MVATTTTSVRDSGGMATVDLGWRLAALVVLLALLAAAVTRVALLGDWRAPLTATVRAAVQLAAVSAVIALVLDAMVWTAGFCLAMLLIGAGTAARRVTGRLGVGALWFVLPLLGGALPPLALALATGVVPFEPIAVLPVAGIIIGGAMTSTSLAGRRSVEELVAQRGTYEAALALGLTRRDGVALVARPAAGLALVPGLDQTRTVGLVTLPGAFVGVLLAGAPPAQAGAAQVLVLVSLLLAQATAAALVVELVAAGRVPVGGAPLSP